jgi:hypothetical protein
MLLRQTDIKELNDGCELKRYLHATVRDVNAVPKHHTMKVVLLILLAGIGRGQQAKSTRNVKALVSPLLTS